MRKYIILMILFYSSLFLAAEGTNLAIIRIEPIGASPETATIVEEILQTEFARLLKSMRR